jgi:hypothetical protein
VTARHEPVVEARRRSAQVDRGRGYTRSREPIERQDHSGGIEVDAVGDGGPVVLVTAVEVERPVVRRVVRGVSVYDDTAHSAAAFFVPRPVGESSCRARS